MSLTTPPSMPRKLCFVNPSTCHKLTPPAALGPFRIKVVDYRLEVSRTFNPPFIFAICSFLFYQYAFFSGQVRFEYALLPLSFSLLRCALLCGIFNFFSPLGQTALSLLLKRCRQVSYNPSGFFFMRLPPPVPRLTRRCLFYSFPFTFWLDQ